jgi:hypothetical protein
MRPMPDERLEKLRQMVLEFEMYGSSPVGTSTGVFMVRRKGAVLRMIGSDGEGWEHVSVSLEDRCPTWDEMCFVKDLFWLPSECVVQYHPPESEYVNNHRFCLHLWRPTVGDIILPPGEFVGTKALGVLT